ncbi:hypothetical protein, partial [Pseudomonas syringae group genomosp. 3]|uniref:hypothetical protein n=1 Tax=Pseudomonas syringae group genomosp. 3 TaxID=251701 RepID=UPI001B80221D
SSIPAAITAAFVTALNLMQSTPSSLKLPFIENFRLENLETLPTQRFITPSEKLMQQAKIINNHLSIRYTYHPYQTTSLM